MTTALAQATCHVVPYRYSPIAAFLAGNTGNFTEPDKQYTLYQDSAGTTPVTAVEQGIGYAADTSGSGNHLIQATGASEPVWSKRYNLLTYSEDFSNAAWSKILCAATSDEITASAGAGFHYARTGVSCPGGVVYCQWEVQRVNNDWCFLGVIDSSLNYFNTATGLFGTNPDGFTAVSIGDGWYRITGSKSIGAVSITAAVGLANGDGVGSFTALGTEKLKVRKADARLSQSIQQYQRIAASTDYDTAGFLPYIYADGVDNSFTCATGAGSTTGFSFQMGIVLEGAAAAQTIYSEAGTNTGIKIERDASNQIVFSGGNGAAYTTATSAALTAGTAYVLTCIYNGSTLSVQINKGTPVTTAFSTLSVGTTSWTMYKANGAASSYLLGRDYGHAMYKDYVLTDAEKNAGIEFFAAKMGISV